MRAEQQKRYEAILNGLDYNLNVIPIGVPSALDKPKREYYSLQVIRYHEPLPHEYFICETGRQVFSCATLETAKLYWKNEIEPEVKEWSYRHSSASPKYICWHGGKQVKI